MVWSWQTAGPLLFFVFMFVHGAPECAWILVTGSNVLCTMCTGLITCCAEPVQQCRTVLCRYVSLNWSHVVTVRRAAHRLLCFIAWTLPQWFQRSLHLTTASLIWAEWWGDAVGDEQYAAALGSSQSSAASAPFSACAKKKKKVLFSWCWVCYGDPLVGFSSIFQFISPECAFCFYPVSSLSPPQFEILVDASAFGRLSFAKPGFMSHTEHSGCDRSHEQSLFGPWVRWHALTLWKPVNPMNNPPSFTLITLDILLCHVILPQKWTDDSRCFNLGFTTAGNFVRSRNALHIFHLKLL